MAITNANILATATTLYTSSGNTVVSTLHLCNNTASTVLVDVHLVPSGGTKGATNIIYSNLNLAPLLMTKRVCMFSWATSIRIQVHTIRSAAPR